MTKQEKLTKAVTPAVLEEFYNGNIAPYLNGMAHAGFTPVGTVISLMGKTAPNNYLICDGSIYNIADYPELSKYFKEQFDSVNFFGGNGTTTFAVPDLRGQFLRGAGTNSDSEEGDGGTVGERQKATKHLGVWGSVNTKKIQVGYKMGQNYPQKINADKNFSHDAYLEASVQNDVHTSGDVGYYSSRPTNTSVLYCIATKNIYIDARFDYSLDEKVVGTWIDGKPLYQKTIQTTMPSDTTNAKRVSIGASIDVVVDYNAMLYLSDGSYMKFGGLNANDKIEYFGKIYVLNNDASKSENKNVIYLITKFENWIDKPVYVTIQYTKTTDA